MNRKFIIYCNLYMYNRLLIHIENLKIEFHKHEIIYAMEDFNFIICFSANDRPYARQLLVKKYTISTQNNHTVKNKITNCRKKCQ